MDVLVSVLILLVMLGAAIWLGYILGWSHGETVGYKGGFADAYLLREPEVPE